MFKKQLFGFNSTMITIKKNAPVLRVYTHEPGEEFWLHYDWTPRIMHFLKIGSDATIGDIQMKRRVETDETDNGNCKTGWTLTDYIGKK